MMKTFFRNLYTLCLCLLMPFAAASGFPADKRYFFQQIPMQSGLSSSVTSMLLCAEKGCVWVGTRSGIGRYDGYLSKTYLHENVSQLLEDKYHQPWAVSGKVFRYDEMKDEFVQVADAEGRLIGAYSLCAWDDGILMGGEGMLYKYTYADGKVRLLHTLRPDEDFWMSKLIRWDEHTLLAIQDRARAILIDVRTGETRPAPFDSKRIIAALLDEDGRVWAALYGRGLRCYDRSGKVLHAYDTTNSELKSNALLTLVERDGQIWVGTDGAGITVFDPGQRTSYTLKQVPGDHYSLQARSILCLYKDVGGGLWAGSVRDGLINIKEVHMKTYTDVFPGQTNGLSEKAVISLYQDEDDCLWIGTDGGGLNHYDARTEKFHHIFPDSDEKVVGVTGYDKDHLLLSLFGKGLFTFHKTSRTLRPLTIVNDSIDTALCRSGLAVNIFQNSPETVLLLSRTPYCYHIREGRFLPLKLGEGVPYVYGDLFSITRQGHFTYLYDRKRIYRVDARRHELELLHTTHGDTLFRSVSIDREGRFWVGGNYGMGYYQPGKQHYTPVEHSLITQVNSLICDRQGRVWLGSEGLLFSYQIAEQKFILYDVPDGVLTNEYLVKARLVARDGDIYLGGANGLLYINRKVYEPRTPAPFLQVADVYAGGERVNDRLTEDARLSIGVRTRPIVVRVSERYNDVFRKSIYRFTVEGLPGKPFHSYQPELTLSSLPPGTFRVKAACSDRNGGWTEDYLVLTLHIRPVWYNSFWFRTLLALLALAVVALAYRRMLRRKNRLLKRAMREHEQQVNEEKVRFLINISHELRTPLTLIHSPLKQLVKDIPSDHPRHALLQGICRQSERMKDILNTVLSVHKMEVGKGTLFVESVQLNDWMEHLVADFRPEAAARGVSLVFQPEPSVQILSFDKEKCTTVLTNLLINALKYTADDTTITVSVRMHEGRVRISVADEGPGLKDIDSDYLFTRFYQGANSRPGTGIGLSYCKILVEQQGGRIGASENETVGSTFWFELPVGMKPGTVALAPQDYLNELLASTCDDDAASEVQEITAETLSRSLLVVDDNKDLTDYLQVALKDRFREVWVAADGGEALKMCREKRPDIVVSDIQMPHMNGYELCKHIKEDLDISHTPVILLTARQDEKSRQYGYKNGADGYLTKPFEVDTLHALIHNLLEKRKRVRTRYAAADPLPCPEDTTFSSADEKFLNRLNDLIGSHLSDEKLDVPFLCREVGMSRSSLYNKMKVLAGMSTNDYITKLRMDRAAHLLLQTKYTVNEIADEIGFASGKYFSSVFKQYTALTPTQYREQHRRKLE